MFEVVVLSVRWRVQQANVLEGCPFGQNSSGCCFFFVVVVICRFRL